MEYAFRNTMTRFLLVITVLGLFVGTMWAQGGVGELTGQVSDPSGAVVSNATVTLTNTATGDTSEFSFAMPVNAPSPALSIDDVQITEGNSGQKNATFTVTLSSVYPLPVKVDYTTANGTAAVSSDYVFKSGSLTFTPGQ